MSMRNSAKYEEKSGWVCYRTWRLRGGLANHGLVDTRVLVRRQKKTKRSFKTVMFDSQVSPVKMSQALEKKKRNIQEFEPGRSAMQWHCGLRLFFKNIYSTVNIYYCTLMYMVCSTKTSFYPSFWYVNGPDATLFEVYCWNDLSSLPF